MSKLTVLGAMFVVLTLGACYRGDATGTAKTPIVANTPPKPVEGELVIGDTAIGALTGDTPATQEALSAKLVGFEIKHMSESDPPPFKDGNPSNHFEAWKGNERQFAIIISDKTIFNVHTENTKISVQGHPTWHVGSTFQDAKVLSRCDCWGGKVVCWKDGEHAALAFDRGCENLANADARGLAVLDGLPIKRMVWNPHPFTGEDDEPSKKPPEHGGGLSGTVHVHDHQPTGGGDPCGGGGGGDDDDGD